MEGDINSRLVAECLFVANLLLSSSEPRNHNQPSFSRSHGWLAVQCTDFQLIWSFLVPVSAWHRDILYDNLQKPLYGRGKLLTAQRPDSDSEQNRQMSVPHLPTVNRLFLSQTQSTKAPKPIIKSFFRTSEVNLVSHRTHPIVKSLVTHLPYLVYSIYSSHALYSTG